MFSEKASFLSKFLHRSCAWLFNISQVGDLNLAGAWFVAVGNRFTDALLGNHHGVRFVVRFQFCDGFIIDDLSRLLDRYINGVVDGDGDSILYGIARKRSRLKSLFRKLEKLLIP